MELTAGVGIGDSGWGGARLEYRVLGPSKRPETGLEPRKGMQGHRNRDSPTPYKKLQSWTILNSSDTRGLEQESSKTPILVIG